MQSMTVNQIRQAFLTYFQKQEHLVIPSFSLVPHQDKSLLLINAGMAPMKNFFLGVEKPPNSRVVTSQKCVRTADIDNVGKTARHATFFEMLGNFSFGDYFKREAIAFAYAFITEQLGIDKKKIWASVYEEDPQAKELWLELTDLPKERIVSLGKADNFWEIGNGTGPCGPCSEIYIDRGEKYGCGSETCRPGCDCDRFMELWNLVFTQYDKDAQGQLHPLPRPNIDTGMGLERIAAVLQGVDSIFDIDTLVAIRRFICERVGYQYGEDQKKDISVRVITDHSRAMTFLISDGVLPSNEGRGYIIRRLIRRLVRHARLLGYEEAFLPALADQVISQYQEAYKELQERRDFIHKILKVEEERFQETLVQGSNLLEQKMQDLQDKKQQILSGEDAFMLYDTYGFPLELTLEILQEKGLGVDQEGFGKAMEQQKQRARQARSAEEGLGWKDELSALSLRVQESIFTGYDCLSQEEVLGDIIVAQNTIEQVQAGKEAVFVFSSTPFYAESGGQLADVGTIEGENFKAQVLDVKKSPSGLFLHQVRIEQGTAHRGQRLQLQVDPVNRQATARNHTATHLLHRALQEILGSHIRQAGSAVSSKRLRFDFNHFEPLTQDQLVQIQDVVNQAILKAYPQITQIMSLEEAQKSKAMALFDEKYESDVRVVCVGDFSKELCGGTHVQNSAEIGLFVIVSETGIASGVRRIEALTGQYAYELFKERSQVLQESSVILKTSPEDIPSRLQALLQEQKELARSLSHLQTQNLKQQIPQMLQSALEVSDLLLVRKAFEDAGEQQMREIAQQLVDQRPEAVVLLASVNQDKVLWVCMIGKKAQEKKAHAGKLIKEVAKITGGGGGGKPNLAMAGGREPENVPKALEQAADILQMLIK